MGFRAKRGYIVRMNRTGEKPRIDSQEALTDRYGRYRRMMCQARPELDGLLRRGAMARVPFEALSRDVAVVLLDAYGVLNLGSQPIPGAPEAVARLKDRGQAVLVVSNNASQSPSGMLHRFGEMGFAFDSGDIVSSGMAVAPFIADSVYRDRPYFLVGSEESALCYAPDPERLMVNHRPGADPGRLAEAEYVLMCSNRDYYGQEQERQLLWLLERVLSLPLLLANPDLAAPKSKGRLEAVAGFTAMELADRFGAPLVGIGKPFPPVFQEALKRFPGVAPEEVLMVGDTLDTDILGAMAMGFRGCLTLSGAYAGWDGDLEALCDARGIRPDFVVPSLAA